jgi:hypothetical protein
MLLTLSVHIEPVVSRVRSRWMLWMLESSSDLSDVYFSPCCLIWDVWKTGERTRR